MYNTTIENMNIAKKTYSAPFLERIELDNEISLIMGSGGAPIEFGDPGSECTGQNLLNPEHFNNTPFA